MLYLTAKKRLLKLTEHSEPNSLANMVAKIDIHVLKFKTKWGWKLAKN